MTAPTVHRGGYRFSPNGLRAACQAVDDDQRQYVESWLLTPAGPRRSWRAPSPGVSPVFQLLQLDDGRVLYSWNNSSRHQVYVRFDRTGRADELGRSDFSLRLLPSTEAGGLAVGLRAGDHAGDQAGMIFQLGEAAAWLEPVARLPVPLRQVAVEDGQMVATAERDGVSRPVRVDIDNGAVAPLVEDPEPGHLLLTGGGQALLAMRTEAGPRLGLAPARGPQPGPLRLLPGPVGAGGAVAPVALDPTARTTAVVVTRGARSQLALYHHESDRLRPVDTPAGVLLAVGAWSELGLWLPYSAPTQPTALAWSSGEQRLAVPDDGFGPARHDARLETFTGAAGAVEAVVYGPDWRDGAQVVVALHGGPERHWTLRFDRLMQLFADSGLSVVAINQRGSTGYGAEHAQAIVGAWGEPDLVDVLAVSRAIVAARPSGARRLAVYGSSYGGYLALLAAAADPSLWTHCAALGAFRSPGALYDEAGPAVRALIDRMRARSTATDALGPRDLDRLLPRIRARVLVVHGARDTIIPVSQSRHLVAALRAAGHRDVTFHEPLDRGHDALREHPGDPMTVEVVRFLSESVTNGGGHEIPEPSRSNSPMERG